jgi:hypothetical protein
MSLDWVFSLPTICPAQIPNKSQYSNYKSKTNSRQKGPNVRFYPSLMMLRHKCRVVLEGLGKGLLQHDTTRRGTFLQDNQKQETKNKNKK